MRFSSRKWRDDGAYKRWNPYFSGRRHTTDRQISNFLWNKGSEVIKQRPKTEGGERRPL